MLNYMRAELYKLFRRKYLWITVLIFMGMESLLVGAYVFTNANGNHCTFSIAAAEIVFSLPVGSYFTILSGEMGFAAQYQNSTLKNEVSFGIPRRRIYLGKLLAQMVAALVSCFLMLAFYLAVCRLTLPGGEEVETLIAVGQCLLAALPIWMGMQGVVCACFFLIKSEIGASVLAVSLYSGLPLVVKIIGLILGQQPVGQGLLKLLPWMPSEVLSGLANAANLADPLHYFGVPWLVGMTWLLVATAIGLAGFSRREIN